jgi:hypothetical protein
MSGLLFRRPGAAVDGAAPRNGAAASPVRQARKDGRQLAVMRTVDGEQGDTMVECEVYPANTLMIEPLTLGPYKFATPEEAQAFVEEATLALEYLGCEIN